MAVQAYLLQDRNVPAILGGSLRQLYGKDSSLCSHQCPAANIAVPEPTSCRARKAVASKVNKDPAQFLESSENQGQGWEWSIASQWILTGPA